VVENGREKEKVGGIREEEGERTRRKRMLPFT
jgi:hypothetical protein